MDIDNLVRMANRIADFFEAQPDRAEALAGIAGHLRRYWEPRMRKALLDNLDTPAVKQALRPIVRDAISAQPPI